MKMKATTVNKSTYFCKKCFYAWMNVSFGFNAKINEQKICEFWQYQMQWNDKDIFLNELSYIAEYHYLDV